MYTAGALIALALGYLVFVAASKEKEGVKLLGQVIGIFVMIMAVAAFACSTMKCMSKYGKYGKSDNCPTMSKMNCPMKDRGYSEAAG